jgi:hypothetical protein
MVRMSYRVEAAMIVSQEMLGLMKWMEGTGMIMSTD